MKYNYLIKFTVQTAKAGRGAGAITGRTLQCETDIKSDEKLRNVETLKHSSIMKDLCSKSMAGNEQFLKLKTNIIDIKINSITFTKETLE